MLRYWVAGTIDSVPGEETLARLTRLVLERLMRYYRFLTELTARKSAPTVTSAEIAQALDVDATQVRKDFAAIGILGMGHVGFDVCEVCRAIRVALGFDQVFEAVLIGTGHLGGALLAYPGFAKYGLQIVAAFDNNKRRIGRQVAGYTVKPVSSVKPFIKRRKIRLAILTTPAEVSQQWADCLVAAGVKAIWNFTPTQLTAPPDVLVRSEHISRGLSEIAHHLKPGSSPAARRAGRNSNCRRRGAAVNRGS
jgi:redox-sensing transcriptional repressor